MQVRETLVRPHLTSKQTLGLVKDPQACLTLSGQRQKSCQVVNFAVALTLEPDSCVAHFSCDGTWWSFDRVEVHCCIWDGNLICAVTSIMRIAHLNMQAVGPAIISSAVACSNAGSQ